jgi:hypothetical protein
VLGGQTESCRIHYLPDQSHCDAEVWTTIEGAALARWMEAQ